MSEEATNTQQADLVELTTDIVSAYVGNNSVSLADMPVFIKEVYKSLHEATEDVSKKPAIEQKPAVNIRRSVTPEYIICLEDGKKFKSLKRHLRTHYDMTPEQYREKWGLPTGYPMVAPDYAAARSKLAKEMGLGRKKRKRRARS